MRIKQLILSFLVGMKITRFGDFVSGCMDSECYPLSEVMKTAFFVSKSAVL